LLGPAGTARGRNEKWGGRSSLTFAFRVSRPLAGAPPPGTSRFRCKFPGCSKLYASTDAVRKHCRKRHLEWLRQIDRYSAHERGTPKPALYCVWGDEEGDM
jgi:hypothetical protein